MAFSFRNIISNINYFKRPEESLETSQKKRRNTYQDNCSKYENIEDSTSQNSSLNLPQSFKTYAEKKASFSDTDIITITDAPIRHKRRKCKKLKVDIKKASQSMNQIHDKSNVENTPIHALIEPKTSDTFSEHFRGFDFNKSFDIYDEISDFESNIDEDFNNESLSDHSTDAPKYELKMCKKASTDIQSTSDEERPGPSTTPESFADVEIDKNEEERLKLLLNYQVRMEKLESFLNKMLNEFQFHIKVSKVFHTRSVVTALPGTDLSDIPKSLGEVISLTNSNPDLNNPTSSAAWNIIVEKEDFQMKSKLRKQLVSIKNSIEQFINSHLQNEGTNKKYLITKKKSGHQKQSNISHKKKHRYFEYPDLRDAMLNLFCMEEELHENDSNLSFDSCKCICKCSQSSPSQTDSGLTSKSNDNTLSITSSIGNFSLDSTTLTAYSESLDQIVSYNSFHDTSLYSTLLQKAAIERITFYIQVHSIQLQCEEVAQQFETKNSIFFHCPSCRCTEKDENGLMKHILSQLHCEKIHFVYKTAYIKKCVSSGKEIQPSTVLNPMTMYRDGNKIVCFGDAVYACSLCFENLIVGESVLITHCSQPQHVERRNLLNNIID
ncbi:unnamed protein product [Leptidea sinapis]|uniref:Uncharacterized protein n=1 Tax=Leptidea sinapis TaxID=189913 RepID=A0A5E4QKU0_9NEOP|nr:unnamed protein product [Leptidea sinapis]